MTRLGCGLLAFFWILIPLYVLALGIAYAIHPDLPLMIFVFTIVGGVYAVQNVKE